MESFENLHVTYAIDNSKRLTLTVYKYLSDERKYIDNIVKQYLDETDLSHMANQLTYCIHELAGNACRANTKRCYFMLKELNIDDKEHYSRGMESFKDEVFDNKDDFHKFAKSNGLYIKFQIKKNNNSIDLSIVNNTPLTSEEEDRIQKKFNDVQGYDNVAEAFAVLADSSEGAGLGIAMMIMMLQEMGLGPDRLNIFSHDDETHAVLNLPLEVNAAV